MIYSTQQLTIIANKRQTHETMELEFQCFNLMN